MPRPDKQEPVVFDLVEDSGPDGAGDGLDGRPATASGSAGSAASAGERPSRLPRFSRRAWLIAAAAVAVLAVTTAAVDLVRDHRRAELMRTSSAGVASLDDPPAETWTVPFDVPAGRGSHLSTSPQTLTMDGLLVVPPANAQDYWVDASTGVTGQALPGFTDVVALDPALGEVAWRVVVDERPVCGPTGYDASLATDVLVCLHGPEGEREVVAIAPDGSARTRHLDLADGEQALPGPDGLVVRAVRIGEPVGPVECDLGICTPEDLADGRDVRITAEDARTGAERWTSTVAFDPTSSDSCQVWSPTDDSSPDGPTIDPELTQLDAGAESVAVGGCGVSATLSVDGVRLDLAADVVATTPAWVTELGSGRFAVEGDSGETVVVDADGKTLRTLDGWVRSGASSPDAADDLWFVTPTSGNGFDAVREDGSVAWTERYGSVALAGRDVVVADRGSTLVGLDRDDGAELWTWDNDNPSGLAGFRTFTDGEVMAVEYLSQDGSAQGRLVAVDLGTGRQLWDVPMTGTAVAVDGHLVEFTDRGVRGLG
jgi:hypothetical protein